MKTTILSIAAAAAITLGAAGSASAAGTVANPSLFEGGAAKVETVHFRGRRHFHRGHGHRVGQRMRCRRLYYRGYVLGQPFARRLFNRFCTDRYGYRHGGY